MATTGRRIGSFLAAVRAYRGLTVEELAACTGLITPTFLRQIERGYRLPDLDEALLLATVLDIEPDWLHGHRAERASHADLPDLDVVRARLPGFRFDPPA